MTANTVIASAPAVDGGPPLRPEQVEDRGDQRAGVADADPEHEGRDVHRPHLGRALARRARSRPRSGRPTRRSPRRGPGPRGTARRSTCCSACRGADDVAVDVGPGGLGGRGRALRGRRAHASAPPSLAARRLGADDLLEIGHAGPRAELVEHVVAPRRVRQLGDHRLAVLPVPEGDGLRRARLLAGGLDVAVAHRAVPSRAPRPCRPRSAARTWCTSPSRRAAAP